MTTARMEQISAMWSQKNWRSGTVAFWQMPRATVTITDGVGIPSFMQ